MEEEARDVPGLCQIALGLQVNANTAFLQQRARLQLLFIRFSEFFISKLNKQSTFNLDITKKINHLNMIFSLSSFNIKLSKYFSLSPSLVIINQRRRFH